MKLTSVRGRNFKGRDFDFKLGDVTVFTGPNFSGKTAVLDAIRVGLIGYLPRLGKQPGATWKLAGAGELMEVSIDTDTTTLSHAWRPTKTGASYEGALPWQTPTVLLDAREYFGMATAERINYVFGLTDPATLGYTDGDLLKKLDDLEVLPTKVSRPLVVKLVEGAKASIRDRKDAIPAWLGKFIDSLKAEQKVCAQQLKRLQADTAGQQAASAESAPPDVSVELKTAVARRDAFAADLAAAQARASAEATATARRAAIESEIASLPKEWSEMALLKSQLDEIPAVQTGSATSVVSERKRLLAAARADLADSLDLQKKVGFETTCPKCGTSVLNSWLADEIAKRQSAVQSWQSGVAEAEYVLTTALSEDAANEQRRRELQSSLTTLREQQSRLNRLRAELAGLSLVVSEPVDTAKMSARLAELNGNVSALQLKNQAFEAYKQSSARADAATAEQVKLSVSVELYKLAVKEVVAFQERLVGKAFNTLLEKARLFTDGILLSPLVYRDGELGRMEGERFVSWEVFSGCEEALALSGLSVALAQHAPCKVVIIDELGRMTGENKRKLLARMVELVSAGQIDHFFGCDVDNADLEIPGVNIIKI
jgi:hypothetical protein